MPLPPINLANVSISLDQFQAVASGDYNAGEVKLTGEHSIEWVNNHVAELHAGLVLGHLRALEVGLARGGVLVGADLVRVRDQPGLEPLLHERVLGAHHHIGRAEERVVAGGVDHDGVLRRAGGGLDPGGAGQGSISPRRLGDSAFFLFRGESKTGQL
jgi:hypothetical protein